MKPAAATEPGVGAPGIGDPYFPLDGNGGIDVRSLRRPRRVPVLPGGCGLDTGITLRTTERLRSFDLDFLLPVRASTVDGAASTFSRPDRHELRITPPADRSRRARRCASRCVRRSPGRSPRRGREQLVGRDGEVEAVNEPHMAPWWFPSNDHPLDKARMDLHITVPRTQAGGGERPPGRGTPRRRTARRTTGGAAEPMATYLAFFVAGRFEVRHGTAHRLPYYARGLAATCRGRRRAAMRGLLRTPGIVRLAERAARPLPVRATGGVVTALNPGFSLETQTRPTYPEGRQPAADGARAGPPVVRRLGVGPPLGGHLAQRGLRDLHGAPVDRGPRRRRARRPGCTRPTTQTPPTPFWQLPVVRPRRRTTSSTGRSTSAGR